MAPVYDVLLHQVFMRELDVLAPSRSRLRQQVNETLEEASMNPRGARFGKLWTTWYGPCEVVTWRAHVGGPRGNRLVHALYQRAERRSVDVVPLLLSRLRKDEGFTYEYRVLMQRINDFGKDYLTPGRPRFTQWDGTL